MNISKHAYDRAKKRCGLNKKSFRRMVDKAISNGISINKTKSHLRRWIDSVVLSHKNKAKVFIHDKYLLLYLGEEIISVYHIPKNILPVSNFIKKEII